MPGLEDFRASLTGANSPISQLNASTKGVLAQNGRAAQLTNGFNVAMADFAEELMANNAAHQILGKLLQNAKQNMQTLLGAA